MIIKHPILLLLLLGFNSIYAQTYLSNREVNDFEITEFIQLRYYNYSSAVAHSSSYYVNLEVFSKSYNTDSTILNYELKRTTFNKKIDTTLTDYYLEDTLQLSISFLDRPAYVNASDFSLDTMNSDCAQYSTVMDTTAYGVDRFIVKSTYLVGGSCPDMPVSERSYLKGLGEWVFSYHEMLGGNSCSLVYFKKLNQEYGELVLLDSSLVNVSQVAAAQNLNLFPNPVGDKLVIDTDWNWNNAVVLTHEGRVLKKFSHSASLDLAEFSAGSYFFIFTDENGYSLRKRVVKL